MSAFKSGIEEVQKDYVEKCEDLRCLSEKKNQLQNLVLQSRQNTMELQEQINKLIVEEKEITEREKNNSRDIDSLLNLMNMTKVELAKVEKQTMSLKDSSFSLVGTFEGSCYDLADEIRSLQLDGVNVVPISSGVDLAAFAEEAQKLEDSLASLKRLQELPFQDVKTLINVIKAQLKKEKEENEELKKRLNEAKKETM